MHQIMKYTSCGPNIWNKFALFSLVKLPLIFLEKCMRVFQLKNHSRCLRLIHFFPLLLNLPTPKSPINTFPWLLRNTLAGFISRWMILHECRYANPFIKESKMLKISNSLIKKRKISVWFSLQIDEILEVSCASILHDNTKIAAD